MILKRTLTTLALAAALIAAAGCGGGDDDAVPADAIAVVGEREVSKGEFDALVEQLERSYRLQKRPFPKVGSPEYNSIKNQIVLVLVQRAQFEEAAANLDVTVTDEDVDKRLQELKQQYFQGNEQRYQEQLKQTGLTDEEVRKNVRAQVVQEELMKKVTADVRVTEAEIQKEYAANRARYGGADQRNVRHILVPTRKQANRLRGQLENGASFATLAKRHSTDPGSKDQGGRLTIARGQTVAPFEKAAFSLPINVLSQPVKTQYGFHLIEPLSKVKPGRESPDAGTKERIRQDLLQRKKNERMTDWVAETRKELNAETTYQVGFKPPEALTNTGTTSDQ